MLNECGCCGDTVFFLRGGGRRGEGGFEGAKNDAIVFIVIIIFFVFFLFDCFFFDQIYSAYGISIPACQVSY